jgi:hypothetical protein
MNDNSGARFLAIAIATSERLGDQVKSGHT